MKQLIRCFVCQRYIDDRMHNSCNDDIFSEDDAWQVPSQYTTRLVNAKNVESKYFNYPDDYSSVPHWRFLYRLSELSHISPRIIMIFKLQAKCPFSIL